jgi:hypothetical protein
MMNAPSPESRTSLTVVLVTGRIDVFVMVML